jgi:16S rRNA (guanine(527)-N(7))-methyltransferase RsmG
MASPLPDLSQESFVARLRACAPEALSERTCAALWAHYRELRKWNQRISLVGPGTAGHIVERHYGEALAALPLLDEAASVLDVGSGAGFPGFVLAAARPSLAVTLVEARERKWAFLQFAARRAELSVRCLNARVGATFRAPPVELVVWRAVQLPAGARAALASLAGRVLVWSGGDEPAPPAGWGCRRRIDLEGSERRRIVEWAPENNEEKTNP